MRMFALLTAFLIGAALPQDAAAWRASNWHDVWPLDGGIYEVVGEPGSGSTDYWCAIGDYAYRELHTPGNQRIYVWRAVGPSTVRPGRKAVHFAFREPPGWDGRRGVVVNVKKVGYNLRAASAHQYCFDHDGPDFIWEVPGRGG